MKIFADESWYPRVDPKSKQAKEEYFVLAGVLLDEHQEELVDSKVGEIKRRVSDPNTPNYELIQRHLNSIKETQQRKNEHEWLKRRERELKGRYMTDDELQEVIDWCKKNRIKLYAVFVDIWTHNNILKRIARRELTLRAIYASILRKHVETKVRFVHNGMKTKKETIVFKEQCKRIFNQLYGKKSYLCAKNSKQSRLCQFADVIAVAVRRSLSLGKTDTEYVTKFTPTKDEIQKLTRIFKKR